jgi:hypothetical protein
VALPGVTVTCIITPDDARRPEVVLPGITDENAFYRFEVTEYGAVTCTGAFPFFQDGTNSDRTRRGRVTNVDLHLVPEPATILGTVRENSPYHGNRMLTATISGQLNGPADEGNFLFEDVERTTYTSLTATADPARYAPATWNADTTCVPAEFCADSPPAVTAGSTTEVHFVVQPLPSSIRVRVYDGAFNPDFDTENGSCPDAGCVAPVTNAIVECHLELVPSRSGNVDETTGEILFSDVQGDATWSCGARAAGFIPSELVDRHVDFGEDEVIDILLFEVSVVLTGNVWSEVEFFTNGLNVPVAGATVEMWTAPSPFTPLDGKVNISPNVYTDENGQFIVSFPERILLPVPPGKWLFFQVYDEPTEGNPRFVPTNVLVLADLASPVVLPVQQKVIDLLRNVYVNVRNPEVFGTVTVAVFDNQGNALEVPSGPGLTIRVLDSNGIGATTGTTEADSTYRVSFPLPLQPIGLQVSGEFCQDGTCTPVLQSITTIPMSPDFGGEIEQDLQVRINVFGDILMEVRGCPSATIAVETVCSLYDEAGAPVDGQQDVVVVDGRANFLGVFESELVNTQYEVCCVAAGYRVNDGSNCQGELTVESGQVLEPSMCLTPEQGTIRVEFNLRNSDGSVTVPSTKEFRISNYYPCGTPACEGEGEAQFTPVGSIGGVPIRFGEKSTRPGTFEVECTTTLSGAPNVLAVGPDGTSIRVRDNQVTDVLCSFRAAGAA